MPLICLLCITCGTVQLSLFFDFHRLFCTGEVSSAEISAWLISSAPPSTPPQCYSSAAQHRAVLWPAMPCRALQLSSAAHRSASSAERIAVLCRALPCFAMLRNLLYCYLFVHASNIRSIIPGTGTANTTPGLYILGCWITNNAPPAQVRPAICSSAAQRSAVRCRALPFVLRCCVVRRCAFF